MWTGAIRTRRPLSFNTAAAIIAAAGIGSLMNCGMTGTLYAPICAGMGTAAGHPKATTQWTLMSMILPSSSMHLT